MGFQQGSSLSASDKLSKQPREEEQGLRCQNLCCSCCLLRVIALRGNIVILRSSSLALQLDGGCEASPAPLCCRQQGTPRMEAGIWLQTLFSIREAWVEGMESASPCTRELTLYKANVLPMYMVQALEILRILPSLTGKQVTQMARFREE